MTTLDIRPEVAAALRDGRAVVALESTLIAHGLPYPVNVETAREAERAVRDAGAVPATIAVLDGVPTVGLTDAEIVRLGTPGHGALKASSRDLASAVALRRTAATTVAATMLLAERAGIRVFATGGIGGVHPAADGRAFDVSADLSQLATTRVVVVCAGAKNILDLDATLEVLETNGVPVVGFGTDTFPAFYLRSSGLPVGVRVDTPAEAARLAAAHFELCRSGIVLAQPLPEEVALTPEEWRAALIVAEGQARGAGIRGAAVTPFLLGRLAEITGGRTLVANRALIRENAALAGRVAVEWVRGAT